jgi:osmoprotectant transport system permease protein
MIAVVFIDDLVSAWERSQDTFGQQTFTFISLTLRGVGLALLLGIPIGMALTRLPRAASPVIAFLGLVQTVPSLVVLGLLISVFRIFGQPLALVAAVLYSIFPVVLNTHIGITEVSPALRDAARGMGMTSAQVLWHVELPLAFPVLLAGVRSAAIYVSGMIVVGALAGAGGLGDYVYNGISRDDAGLIWLGALPVLVLTLLLLWSLGRLTVLARKNSSLGMSLGGAVIIGLSLYAAYGVVQTALERRRADLIVGAKDFTEGQILAEILKQTIEAHTDLAVEVRANLGTSVILKALKSGQIDLYPEYTGVLLTSKDGLDMEVPEDKAAITPLVRDEMRRRYGLILLKPFGLNNTYAPSVTQETARRYRLQKISDLQRTPRMRVVVDLSFMTRPDGWPGLVKRYELHFDSQPIQASPNLLYKALEQGQADVVIGFATDWQIEALKLVVLEDDRGYFPSYHAAPLAREDVLRRHPQLGPLLDRLGGQLDDQTMRRLNYAVSVNRRSEADVAHEFLVRKGIIEP